MDEISRVKPSQVRYSINRWPLIEKEMSRRHCLAWMRSHGYPTPPRSSCVFCPYHSNREWRRLKDQEPDAFARAVTFERDFQAAKAKIGTLRCVPWLHRQRIPLDQVDLSTEEERGQLTMFNNECEGMCGV